MVDVEDVVEIVAETFTHEQTGKIHIVGVAFPPAMWRCYCSLTRRSEPAEREIELSDEDVCAACASRYVVKHPEEFEDEFNVEKLAEAFRTRYVPEV